MLLFITMILINIYDFNADYQHNLSPPSLV